MSSNQGTIRPGPPAVDERLVAVETRYQIEDGKVAYVAPAEEPHASRHSKLSALLELHVAADYDVASDMLTRSSEWDDFAPDASVFPSARDPETGRRQLEELAFEVISSERLSHAGGKAQKLIARGVRRVFAVDTERGRAFEWSRELANWAILSEAGQLEDPALAVPLPIAALVRATKVDDAAAHALLAKGNAVLTQVLEARSAEGKATGKREGQMETVLRLLARRFGVLNATQTARVQSASLEELDRMTDQVLDVQRLEDIVGP